MMENFRFMSRFNQWVNGRLYDAVAQLSEEEYNRETGAFFGSINRTLNHILIIDRIQISRFSGPNIDRDIKSVNHVMQQHLPDLRRVRDELDNHIISTIATLHGDVLDRRYALHMTATGRDYEMIGRHMLLTMFNHQTHHRGQVHCMLTQMGYAVPALDVPVFAAL